MVGNDAGFCTTNGQIYRKGDVHSLCVAGFCTTNGQIYRKGDVHSLCVQTLKDRHRARLAVGTIGAAAGIEDTVDARRHSNSLGWQGRIASRRQARPIAQRQRTGQHGRAVGCHSCGDQGWLWRQDARCSKSAVRCRHCTLCHSRCWPCDRPAVRRESCWIQLRCQCADCWGRCQSKGPGPVRAGYCCRWS